jgi:hypothetical protein
MINPADHNCIDDAKLIEDIKKFGWVVMSIKSTTYLPSFSYTVGLWKHFNHPELIAFGMTLPTLQAILNVGGEVARSGERLETGREYNIFFENGNAQLLAVDPGNLKDYFGYAIWYNGTGEFPALQLVWTDENHKYPWESNFNYDFIYRQPLLDRNVDFKFREERNLGIFTTRQWLEEDKPVVHVVHDDDGDWQFLTGDQMLEDVKIVALEEMVTRDPTLNDVFNLDYNEQAKRRFIGDEWVRIGFQPGEEDEGT